jgi:nitrogen fixation protein NifB
MKKNFDNHPCFNDKARHLYGRVHLPVAPRCNIQCNFCNRKFDCVNESRPGITSTIITPEKALTYVNNLTQKNNNLAVVGIAGPGDPFANPEETMQTLRLISKKIPDKLLCVSTNGLNILPYIDELAELNVSHVTLTVNTVDPDIGAKIYAWVRYKKRIRNSEEGAGILLENQLLAIKKLKEKGVIVKVNTIVIPGINDDHIEDVAKKMSELGVDILNCIPYLNNEECNFSYIQEPPNILMTKIRIKAGKYIKQMNHCTRCRADAVGLLGEKMNDTKFNELQKAKAACQEQVENYLFLKNRPHVAVASLEGLLINQHLGEANEFLIYEKKPGNVISKREVKKAPIPGGKDKRWKELANILSDCSYVLVNGVGEIPQIILENSGIKILLLEGLIEEALKGIFMNKSIDYLIKRKTVCGQSCSGSGTGCG